MKILISKFIIIIILVFTSINVCLSNDNICDDSSSYTQSQSAQSSTTTLNANESKHCICSLSCHNLFDGFTSLQTKTIFIVISASPILFIQSVYPQVLISQDKPPII